MCVIKRQLSGVMGDGYCDNFEKGIELFIYIPDSKLTMEV